MKDYGHEPEEEDAMRKKKKRIHRRRNEVVHFRFFNVGRAGIPDRRSGQRGEIDKRKVVSSKSCKEKKRLFPS